jgi:hypothetical protein
MSLNSYFLLYASTRRDDVKPPADRPRRQAHNRPHGSHSGTTVSRFPVQRCDLSFRPDDAFFVPSATAYPAQRALRAGCGQGNIHHGWGKSNFGRGYFCQNRGRHLPVFPIPPGGDTLPRWACRTRSLIYRGGGRRGGGDAALSERAAHAAVRATAAVSIRSVVRPNRTPRRPACRRARPSAAVRPPSGPTTI